VTFEELCKSLYVPLHVSWSRATTEMAQARLELLRVEALQRAAYEKALLQPLIESDEPSIVEGCDT
jgi:hypothetical protein